MTEKQKRFVLEYMVSLNATDAARRAGYSDPNIGRQLITNPNVAAEIQKRRAKISAKLEISQEAVVRELAAVAFANGTDFATVQANGFVEIIPTDKLPADKRKAVASIKAGRFGTEIKTHDKIKALELLGKHLGMFSDKNGAVPQEKNNLLEAIKDIEVDTDAVPEAQ